MAATSLSPLITSPTLKTLPNQTQPKTKTKTNDSSRTGSLKYCKHLTELRKLHCQITKQGLLNHASTITKLISTSTEMGSFGSLIYAKNILNQFRQDNQNDGTLFMYNSLIRGYSSAAHGNEAIWVNLEMPNLGISPDKYTFPFLPSACTKILASGEGFQFAKEAVELFFEMEEGTRPNSVRMVNTLMVNALVDMYMKCGAFDTAKRLFDECREKNLVVCNTIMSNYVLKGMAREALAILDEMLGQRLLPERVTISQRWDSISDAMIDMYMKCGKQEMACAVFDRMANKTVVSWNSLIAGYIRNGDVGSAWEVFNNMPESDLVSWNTIISALEHLILRSGCMLILKEQAWTAAIGAMAMEGNGKQAIELFNEMLRQGVKPDACGIADSMKPRRV
ncbi:hypothetical protein CRYUN_Cryun36dG0059400 [Craigia yunnanensis]